MSDPIERPTSPPALRSRRTGPLRFLQRLPYAVVFVGYFLYELVLSNLRVAHDVLTPAYRTRPGIVRVPTSTATELQLVSLANALTMTPGTLTLEVDRVTGDLYVHTMYLDDPDRFLADVARMERFLLEAMR